MYVPESKGSRTRSPNVQGQEKVNSSGRERERELTFPLTYCLFRPSVDWMNPTHIGESGSSLLSLLTDSNADLFQKPPHRHPQNNVSPAIQASLSPGKSTHKINHHKNQISFLFCPRRIHSTHSNQGVLFTITIPTPFPIHLNTH